MSDTLQVLVVGDDGDDLQLPARLLAADGCDVRCAGEPLAFAEALAADLHQAVVLVLPMTWTSGPSVVETLHRSREIPVIVLADRASSPEVVDSLRRGAVGHVRRDAGGLLGLAEQLRDALRSSQRAETDAPLAEALAHLDLASFVCDPDGRLVRGNDALARRLGVTLSEARGDEVLSALVPSLNRSELLGRLRREGPVRLVERSGEEVSLVLGEAAGQAVIVGVIAPRATVPAAERPIDGTALGLVHDLKAPLRTVLRAAESLASSLGDSDGVASEHLRVIRDAVLAARERVTSLLGDARGRASSDLVTDASEVLRHVRTALSATIEAAGAEVTADPLPTLRMVPEELFTLLQNLIENAVKFRGDDPPRVRISASRRGSDWVFAVTDNGCGVPDDERERMFDMFHRGANARGTEGTGIGLAVCRGIVERAGGRIWCESSEGTSIYFTLPAIQLVSPETPSRSASRRTALEVPHALAHLDDDGEESVSG